ncbi:MAG: hypothetical protein ACOX51_07130 [Myxococcota bacterium]
MVRNDEIGPEIDRIRTTISKIIDICPENDDFAQVGSLLSSLFFIEARLLLNRLSWFGWRQHGQ